MVGTLSKIAAFFGSKSSLNTSSAYPSAYSVHVSSRVEEDLPLPRLRRASVFASFRVNKKWRGES